MAKYKNNKNRFNREKQFKYIARAESTSSRGYYSIIIDNIIILLENNYYSIVSWVLLFNTIFFFNVTFLFNNM